MRSVYSSKDVTPKNLLSHVFNYLKNEIFRTSEFLYLWLPAYNYSAFTTKCADQSINTTDFGLAHLILTNTEEKLFDVFFDPVFSYIIYPGSGKRLNLNSDIYSPFSNNHPANLGSEDWLVFTKNAFQPSHLMNIEQRFFGDSHPYRYKKTFDIELINPSKLTKLEYWVRPRDSKFVEYRLKSLQNEAYGNMLPPLELLGEEKNLRSSLLQTTGNIIASTSQKKSLDRTPRVALIIGNSNYESSPLDNPVNDAELMQRTLEDKGFETILKLDDYDNF